MIMKTAKGKDICPEQNAIAAPIFQVWYFNNFLLYIVIVIHFIYTFE